MKNINDINKINTDKSKKVQDGPFCFFMWILKVEIIIIAIIAIIAIIYNCIPDKTKFVFKYNIEKCFLNENLKEQALDFKDITLAINNNKNLEDAEKIFLLTNLENEIKENKDYIDMKKIKDRLERFDVSYCKKYYYNQNTGSYEIQYPKFVNANVAGRYNSFFNTIYLYEKTDAYLGNNYNEKIYDFNECDKSVYFHEINHLLTKNAFQKVNDSIILETINELFAREYFYQEDDKIIDNKAYGTNMIYAYALAEILSEDSLRKYKFDVNESILISELLEIDNNMEQAYKLVSGINSLSLYENQNEEIYKQIHDGYAYFYEKKYNKKLTESLEVLAYFYGTQVQTEEERKALKEYLGMGEEDEILRVIPRGYVSKEFVNQYPNIQIEYTKNGNKEKIEIKD